MAENKGMSEYTKWWIAHPWHVTEGMPVPPDCDCKCCKEEKEAASANRQAMPKVPKGMQATI